MAYAQKSGEFSVEKNTPDLPWFGFVPRNVPYQQVIELDSKFAEENGLDAAGLEARRSAAREHLQRSIEHYRRAVALDPENLTVALGLAWSLDQAEQDEEAMTLYREVIERGWQKEKEMKIAGLKFQSIVREGAEYLQPHLDATADRAEIESLQQKIEVIQKIRRPVTPLAIPLGPGTRLEDTYDDAACVPFDADGSGYRRLWTWTRPQAAWLVYDPRGTARSTRPCNCLAACPSGAFGNMAFKRWKHSTTTATACWHTTNCGPWPCGAIPIKTAAANRGRSAR